MFFLSDPKVQSNTSAYLPDYIVDDLVNSEANVGVDGEHLSERVFILRRVQVTVQQTANHIQEGWIILLQLHLT